MESPEDIRGLFARFLNRECNEEDLRRLFTYFGTLDESALRDIIRAEMENPETSPGDTDAERQARLDHIHGKIRSKLKHSSGIIPLYRRLFPYAAAIMVFALAGASWHFFLSDKPGQEVVRGKYGNDVSPGSNRATLTLADGSRIDLDKAAGGLIARQEGTAISKNEAGLIAYEMQESDHAIQGSDQEAGKTIYNTVTTPKGGQYQVWLPDGSKVWLNAASSLTYPTHFTGPERRVVLKGEGYFEVAGNEKQPFVVASAGQEIAVLGTRFNVNAYADEVFIRTTLVEGSVSLAHMPSGESKILQPGQQSAVKGSSIQVREVDTRTYTGWKDGEFIFHNAKLKDILLRLQRWYDVEVDTEGLPDEAFYGEINRDVMLSEVLDMIQATSNVRFKIKGRRLMIKE